MPQVPPEELYTLNTISGRKTMLDSLFHKGKDEEEKRQMVEGMQSMSDQIAALGKQLAEKNAEIDQLHKAAGGAAADASAVQAAQKQVADLQKQLHDLQLKMAGEQAAREAEAMAADLIRKQQEAARAKEATAAPAASGAKTATVAPSTSGGIAVGGTAYVTRAGGLPLRLRSGAGLNHEAIDHLPPGTQMTLLDGPQQADNHAWWHIRTADGREGWVAGEDLRSQPD
jgi:SH3 domain-containing protein